MVLVLVYCKRTRATFSHQRGPVFVREGRSGSRGVQVAEEAVDLPQGDAAAPVAHLEEEEVEDKARVQFRVHSDEVSNYSNFRLLPAVGRLC